ncbi:hypothetical protein FB451DRAFT_1229851 [Mycena latifolia]|nr:hypothetical protein FB451DRAFT_1229851 [Mycena latifolia]
MFFLSAPKVFSSENAGRGLNTHARGHGPLLIVYDLVQCRPESAQRNSAYNGCSLFTNHDRSQIPQHLDASKSACTRHWERSAEPSTRSHVPSQSVPWSGCPATNGTGYSEGLRAVIRRTRGNMHSVGAQRAPSFSALRSTCSSTRLANGEMVCNSIQTTLCLLCIQIFYLLPSLRRVWSRSAPSFGSSGMSPYFGSVRCRVMLFI